MIHAGSRPVSREHERDHRRRRRLAVRTADDDRRLRRDELGEEVRARACPRSAARCAVETTTSNPRRRLRLAAEVDVDPVERAA